MSLYKISFTGTKAKCQEISDILSDAGYDIQPSKVRNTASDSIECELIDHFLEQGNNMAWTATRIKQFLESASGLKISINFVGSALKKLGYEKSTIKVDGIVTKGYRLSLKCDSSSEVVNPVMSEIAEEVNKKHQEMQTLTPKIVAEFDKVMSERMQRFLQAKEARKIVEGICAADYDNPDDFNVAVQEAINEKSKNQENE
jgi:hypothetical protein